MKSGRCRDWSFGCLPDFTVDVPATKERGSLLHLTRQHTPAGRANGPETTEILYNSAGAGPGKVCKAVVDKVTLVRCPKPGYCHYNCACVLHESAAVMKTGVFSTRFVLLVCFPSSRDTQLAAQMVPGFSPYIYDFVLWKYWTFFS